jgi:hypothetical protein
MTTRTRITTRIGLVLGGLLAIGGAQSAAAATTPTISASPNPVERGQVLTIRGSNWVQSEFCRPRVTLTLGRRRVLIGRAQLRPENEGRFRLRWLVPARTVLGSRTIYAAQRCESGRDASVSVLRATTHVRVRRAATRRIARRRSGDLLAVLTAIKTNPDRPGLQATVTLQAFRRRADVWRSLGRLVVGERNAFFWGPVTGEGGVRGLRVDPEAGRIGFRLLITPSVGYPQRYRFSVAGGRLHRI